MVKEYYGTRTIFTDKVKLVLLIAGFIVMFLFGNEIISTGAGGWSKNIGVAYFIDKYAHLIPLIGFCLNLITIILAYLVYENHQLKKTDPDFGRTVYQDKSRINAKG